METNTEKDANKPAALPPELAALQAQAAALEAETAPPAAPGEPGEGAALPAPVDYLADARGLVNIAAESLAAFYPSTAAVLTDEKRERIAAAAAPVMEKYGFNLAGLFGKWGPEIGLGFALAQVALPLAAAIRADRAAAAAEKAAQPAPPPPDASSPATTSAPPASDLYAKA